MSDTRKIKILGQIMPEELTHEQIMRFQRQVANWTYLSSRLANGVTLEDLGVMLKMELNGKCRDFIIYRLLGRISTELKAVMHQEVTDFVNDKDLEYYDDGLEK